MRKRIMPVAAGLAAIVLGLGLAACGDDDGGGTGGTTTGKVGVILPDSATSPRWEANDRPLLKAAFDAAGMGSDIQNADGDKAKFATLCDGMITAGVNVLLIVNLDSDSGKACLTKAQAAGIKTIDYDRLTLGGNASYYVSFDNVAVGRLMGEGLTKCLTDAARPPTANIVFINGDPTDNNAALFKQGYVEGLKPKVDSGRLQGGRRPDRRVGPQQGRHRVRAAVHAERRQGRRRRLRQRHDGAGHHRPA